MNEESFIKETIRGANKIVLTGFEKNHPSRIKIKDDQSNILTETDIASEKFVISQITKFYPQDSIIAEELGFVNKNSRYVWIIDPIDGTSNFAAGIPWFGIMIARLKNWAPIVASISLPAQDELYYAETGAGTYCNDRKIFVTTETELKNVLVAYGLDFAPTPEKLSLCLSTIGAIAQSSRNYRSSGSSAVEACFVASGKLGVCAVHTAKIWDNVAPALVIQEAGGIFTDISGNPTDFHCTKANYMRDFTYLAGPPVLHSQLLSLLKI